jgi:hypothetical protein
MRHKAPSTRTAMLLRVSRAVEKPARTVAFRAERVAKSLAGPKLATLEPENKKSPR